ncbi:hypothetical protein BKA62DRAFT_691984 [Auriculariales sp. MPI-PUGE-AT-0066]|nr:hypothetical protein BKA62DRAFT_691984 [Auriculariales sp. MPI-PUGE-AT-0066]
MNRLIPFDSQAQRISFLLCTLHLRSAIRLRLALLSCASMWCLSASSKGDKSRPSNHSQPTTSSSHQLTMGTPKDFSERKLFVDSTVFRDDGAKYTQFLRIVETYGTIVCNVHDADLIVVHPAESVCDTFAKNVALLNFHYFNDDQIRRTRGHNQLSFDYYIVPRSVPTEKVSPRLISSSTAPPTIGNDKPKMPENTSIASSNRESEMLQDSVSGDDSDPESVDSSAESPFGRITRRKDAAALSHDDSDDPHDGEEDFPAELPLPPKRFTRDQWFDKDLEGWIVRMYQLSIKMRPCIRQYDQLQVLSDVIWRFTDGTVGRKSFGAMCGAAETYDQPLRKALRDVWATYKLHRRRRASPAEARRFRFALLTAMTRHDRPEAVTPVGPRPAASSQKRKREGDLPDFPDPPKNIKTGIKFNAEGSAWMLAVIEGQLRRPSVFDSFRKRALHVEKLAKGQLTCRALTGFEHSIHSKDAVCQLKKRVAQELEYGSSGPSRVKRNKDAEPPNKRFKSASGGRDRRLRSDMYRSDEDSD